MSGRPWAARVAARLAGALLRLYPRDFRAEMGGALTEDARRRAAAMAAGRGRAGTLVWLGRLAASLLVNAAGAWRDRLGEGRRGRHRRRGGVSWLDVKLGLRMVLKYPGLSLVSVAGMAVAVAVGAGVFGSIHGLTLAELPFPEGGRVVAIETRDTRDYGRTVRQVLHDVLVWREDLASVREVSAFRDEPRNLIAPDGTTELVRLAEITASGMAIPRVPPALGRTLLEEDERPGAPPVVVLAWEEWRDRFDRDPGVLGRTLRLGTAVHTIVGVMPEGFRFPINHRFWVPLRLEPGLYERGDGPSLHVLGRLAEGVSLEQAQAELSGLGAAAAEAYPATHEHLRPRVVPYTLAYGVDIDSPEQARLLRMLPYAVSLVLVLVAVNVGILVYARTATRLGEIAVRTALGATRRRIVGQLFVEALVLSALAAGAGLAVAGAALPEVEAFLRRVSPGRVPFWWDFGLTPGLVAYVGGLTVLAGVIVGVVPGLKATGRRVQAGLQQVSTRGAGMRLGRLWTTLIVTQVALVVAVLPFVVYGAAVSLERSRADLGYAAEEFLRVRLAVERTEAPPTGDAEAFLERERERLRAGAAELVRRLEAEPGVSAVTFGSHFPGGGWFWDVEVEGGGIRGVRALEAAPDLFRVFDVPVLAGRDFGPSDGAGSAGVIVDRVFVEEVLGGGDALGRRIRRVPPGAAADESVPRGPWLEIVGVVPDFTGAMAFDPAFPKLYMPRELREASAVALAVRAPGGVEALAPRLRSLAAAVDPGLQLEELTTAAAFHRTGEVALRFIAWTMVAVTLAVLLLSAGGVYALMSFTVARRRREIGIRSALGAAPRRVLAHVFARAATQIGAGVALGLVLAVGLDGALGGTLLQGRGATLLPAVAVLMAAVGLMAALGPARRGLAVEPTEALREE